MQTEGIRIHQTGDASVMQYEQFTLPALGDNHVLIANETAGLNFIDVYFRTGVYPVAQNPFTPGVEGAGIVVDCGKNVTSCKVGDRVGYISNVGGGYAKHIIVNEHTVITLPDAVSFDDAAAAMLKGMTCECLMERVFALNSNHTILLYAASGGVGLLASQWAKHRGATVIGLAGGDEKCQNALNNGCDYAIDYNNEDVVVRVKDITNGAGVDVVYDSVAQSMVDVTLNSLKPRGMWVCYGQSSGVINDFSIGLLGKHGSLFLTRPSLFAYIATRDEFLRSAKKLLDMIGDKKLKIYTNQTYALTDVQKAHQDLESRKTTGSTLIKI